ncbi:homocysteine S-methyltransferase, partial [Enterococcus faecium]
WQASHLSHQFASFVPQWLAAGARTIGGCCRTTPKDIATVARALSVSDSAKL